MPLENIKSLSISELTELKSKIEEEIKSRNSKLEKFLLSENDLFTLLQNENIGLSRYNGGWMKKVIGLDKSKTNGYSIVGDFISKDEHMEYYNPETLVIDCSISGSRKNQEKYYTLFKVISKEKIEILFKTEKGNDAGWAPKMWDKIEENL